MANDREIKIVISAQDDYTAALNKFKTAMGDTTTHADHAGAGFEKLKGTIESLAGRWLELATIAGATAFLYEARAAALESEVAFNKLSIQIDNLGLSYKNLAPEINDALQKTAEYAIVQDDSVAGPLQKLILQTGNYKRSLAELNIVYDLAYLKGIDAGEAADVVGKAVAGNVEGLSRMFPELKNVDDLLGKHATTAEKAAYAEAFLAEKVQGATEKMTEHEKSARRVEKAYEDLKEKVGGYAVAAFDYLLKGLAQDKEFQERTQLLIAHGHIVEETGAKHKKTAAEIAAASRAASDAWEDQDIRLKNLSAPGIVDGTLQALTNVISFGGPMAQKVELAGISLGKSLSEGIQTGMTQDQANLAAFNVGDLNFSMKPDYKTDLDALYGFIDERYAAEEAAQNALLDMHLTFSDQQIAIDHKTRQTVLSSQFAAGNQAIALLQIVGSRSKELMMAALILQKGLAIAQVWIQTQVASSAALAPPPLGLGPVYGAPLAASIEFWGNAQMALIAATGIAEAAFGGASKAPMGVGGGGGVGSLPISPPSLSASSQEAAPTQNITLIVQSLDPSSVNWDRMMENNIKPALEKLSGDGNVALNIKVANG